MNRRIVTWDAEGNPVATTERLVTKAQIQDLYAAAAGELFSCEDPFDPDFIYNGLPLVEVIVKKQIRAAARNGEGEAVMDRLAGRPKQETLSTKLTLTYEDALREIERKENAKRFGQPVPSNPFIEATIVTERT